MADRAAHILKERRILKEHGAYISPDFSVRRTAR